MTGNARQLGRPVRPGLRRHVRRRPAGLPVPWDGVAGVKRLARLPAARHGAGAASLMPWGRRLPLEINGRRCRFPLKLPDVRPLVKGGLTLFANPFDKRPAGRLCCRAMHYLCFTDADVSAFLDLAHSIAAGAVAAWLFLAACRRWF